LVGIGEIVESIKRISILGCPFDAISFSETVELIKQAVNEGKRVQFCPGSIDFVMKARRDPQFSKDLWAADCVFADGVPIVWAASLIGDPIKGRVSGTDIVWKCAEISAELGCSVAMIGGKFNLTKAAAEKMHEQYPAARLHPIPTPFPLGEKDNQELVREIRAVDARIVLVALGAPRQERWVQSNLAACGANVGIGIGSAFDIISGYKPRAPKWMCNNGFEWLYRMMQDPKRLGKRYIIDDSPFLFHLGWEIIRKRINGGRSKL
jgi:N-acetylglucosaminyldiphosphoundecaprenol N-acetyl-beta-D-mannosaminyltransferase